MTNKKSVIGPWVIIIPEKVITLGLMLDRYKENQLPRLWKEAEAQALERLNPFFPQDLFHEEIKFMGEMIFSTRYYTPPHNRRRKKDVNAERLN